MTGRVVVRGGFWHLVINYKGADGTYKQHWRKTELKERGNKRIAEKMLSEAMASFAVEVMEEEQKEFSTRKLSTYFNLLITEGGTKEETSTPL